MQDISGGDREAYRRQLAAAESSSISSLVHNLLGVPAQLELDFGDHMCISSTPVIIPLQEDRGSAPIILILILILLHDNSIERGP